MPVSDLKDTKQQIIEKLDEVPAEKLPSVLDYVQFILAVQYDDEPLSEHGRALIQEELDDPRSGIPDEEFRKELGL